MEFNEELKNFLLKRFPDARTVSGGKEVVMRCRFCGDSQTDIKDAHFYISIKGNAPLYNCFKCGASGIINPDILKGFLSNLSEEDMRMMISLKAHNKSLSKYMKRIVGRNNKYPISIVSTTKDDVSAIKLRYINKRLGLNLSYDDLVKDKVVLNVLDLLDDNRIKNLTRRKNIVEQLNNSSIGFLSMDNSMLTMRNIAKKGTVDKYIDNRYNNYKIFKDVPSKKFYCIPSKCNMVSDKPITVHIAEGALDILSVFYNLCNGNRDQSIYIAICGKSYLFALRECISSLGIMNGEYHFYVDNDVKEYELSGVKKVLNGMNLKGYIHRNGCNGEKDFGVPLSRIVDTVSRV